ncbi:MAG TPA: tripartite tricarboxylate transporter substrate binding protein [Burkholderiales bacterium]|nr:tripartite tricarboxylate transporter substrate binding protein [Burkholderiales bacterium]
MLKLVAAVLISSVSCSAFAQQWPTKTVRIIATLAPGSAVDIVARTLAERLTPVLGQPVIVENRPGASTMLAAGLVAKAEPDGHTLLVNTSSHTVSPFVVPHEGFDPARDLAAVTMIATLPTVLVVPASKGYQTVQDLVAAGKAKPGSLNFGSAAASTQLNAERFRRSAKFEAVHIGFKGAPEALNELIAGRIDFYFSPVGPALGHIRDGRLRALAIGGPKRSSALPDLPTTLEAGYPDSDYNFWVGLFAPAKTPREIVNRLYKETVAAVQTAEVKERLTRLGAEPLTMAPEQFDAHVKEELRTNAVLVKEAGISGN